MLLLGKNKVPRWVKEGGGLDWAHGPHVCHLCTKGLQVLLTLSMNSLVGGSVIAYKLHQGMKSSPPWLGEEAQRAEAVACKLLLLSSALSLDPSQPWSWG